MCAALARFALRHIHLDVNVGRVVRDMKSQVSDEHLLELFGGCR